MTIIIKSQRKEIEKGTLRIEKVLEKYSQKPYYIGTFKPKNFDLGRVIIKRHSPFSMRYLEEKL